MLSPPTCNGAMHLGPPSIIYTLYNTYAHGYSCILLVTYLIFVSTYCTRLGLTRKHIVVGEMLNLLRVY